MNSSDEKFMQQAFKLAKKGLSCVEPNPMVGCVIVKDGEVIGRGFHEQFGGPHAEVNALVDCKKNGHNPKGATVYVTLEPCCHHGKTGPCTEALIRAKVGKVIIAVMDPSDKVAGKGIEILREACIEVTAGLMEEEAAALNGPFFKYTRTKQPWIILKWAQSKDGYLASASYRWISCEKSRQHAHSLRRRCQAILVGINTVLNDDPQLTPRPDRGTKPLRVILDTRLMIPMDAGVLDVADGPTLLVTAGAILETAEEKIRQLNQMGIDFLMVDTQDGRCDLKQVFFALGQQGIQQVLIEGGSQVLNSCIRHGFGDELDVYIAPDELGEEGQTPATAAMKKLVSDKSLRMREEIPIDSDTLITARLGGY